MRSEHLPQLTLGERDRRHAALRASMREEGFDVLFIWGNNRSWGNGLANFRYITHVGAREGIALFPASGAPVVFAGNPHFYEPYNLFATHQSWTQDVRPLSGLKPVLSAVSELGLEDARFGIVDSRGSLAYHTIPYYPFASFMESFPRASFSDATGMVERIRMIKSAEEITFLERAGEIGRHIVDAMIETAAPGVLEAEVYAAMHSALLVHGGEDYAFNLFDTGSLADPDLHLHHGKENPLAPTDRVLQADDLVITEFHSNYGGYLGACEKSIFLGHPPSGLQRVHEVCLAAFDNGTSAIRPGVLFADAVEAFREPVISSGCDFVELGLHGHGVGSPEFPTRVYKAESTHSLAGDEADEIVLEPGMVFGTNIDVHDPLWRRDVGLMFGDTVVVTEGGSRTLVGTPRELEKV